MKRRDFLLTTGSFALGTIAAGSATASLNRLPRWWQAEQLPYAKQLGLQLWTVRNQMAEDPKSTLEAIAKAGYQQVELGSVLGMDSTIQIARDLGLQVNSAFFNWETIVRPGADNVPTLQQVIDQANDFGLKHLVFGYIAKGHRETADQIKKIIENANRASEAVTKAGMKMCYHNHSFEFAPLTVDGKETCAYEMFIQEFDPEHMHFEVDVFWVKIGGWDPLKTMKRLKGRVTQVHLKDLLAGSDITYDEGNVPAEAFQELGDGTIDMKKVAKLAKEIGVEHCHVEQDQSPAPLDSIVQSIKYMQG